MRILVTGAAGFIGFHFCELLLQKGYTVVGIDNLNPYYPVSLKKDRLAVLGVTSNEFQSGKPVASAIHGDRFQFVLLDLEDRKGMDALFGQFSFDIVCNLAAQAGVRYSLEQPFTYIDSNVTGFLNVLECCRHHQVKKLIYASSSSVYGLNEHMPFSVNDTVDHPISLYAATKKSNELMAHTYSHLFGINTVGLRFFTVYGPWGRPDMALFLFTDAIFNQKPIDVFNHGELSRDFTYVDDITQGMEAIVAALASGAYTKPYGLYNIGNSKPVRLLDFIEAIERHTGISAQKNWLPMQPGDVARTWADVSELQRDFHYQPQTDLDKGVKAFVDWYKAYYGVGN